MLHVLRLCGKNDHLRKNVDQKKKIIIPIVIAIVENRDGACHD